MDLWKLTKNNTTKKGKRGREKERKRKYIREDNSKIALHKTRIRLTRKTTTNKNRSKTISNFIYS